MADTNENSNLQQDVDGYEIVTEALMELMNSCPLIGGTGRIRFSMLDENNGIGMFPESGAVIEREDRDILGRTTQYCVYPFYLIYRIGTLNDANKILVKEWLDNLGRWLEKQSIKVGDSYYQLLAYPELSGNRKFTSIKRTTPSFLNENNTNKTEDWAISITARYINQF